MKKIILVIAIALFVVCAESNPRDQCEQHRMRNGMDKTADDCAILYLLMNSLEMNPDRKGTSTQAEIESTQSYARTFKLYIAAQCIQSSIEAEKCRKIKPGFSNR